MHCEPCVPSAAAPDWRNDERGARESPMLPGETVLPPIAALPAEPRCRCFSCLRLGHRDWEAASGAKPWVGGWLVARFAQRTRFGFW